MNEKNELRRLNSYRDVVKTRHKDKNFRKTRMMEQDGFLIPDRDLASKTAILKAAAHKLIERLGPNTKSYLKKFSKKQIELKEKEIISFAKYFLIEDFNLTKDEQETFQGLQLTMKQIQDDKIQKAEKKLKEYRDLGFFD